jgi:OOP family OmpA-OmpF porin
MSPSMKSLSFTAGLALLAFTAGCATLDPVPAQSERGPLLPDPGADQEYQVNFPDPGRGVPRYVRLTIGEDLSQSCRLVQPHFDFDSARLSPLDESTLRSLADCLDRPELKEADLAIVGRADSRGNAAYNAELGLKRAESVKKLLVAAGIDGDRIHTASSGSDGALGDDKGMYSYGYDRRVDVLLTGIVHAPR